MMFYHICALLLIGLVLGLAAVRRCSLYSPLVISGLVWLAVFAVGLILHKRFYPIQEMAFIAWIIWFMATCLIFFLLYPSHIKNACNSTEIRRLPVDYTLPLLLLIIWLGYRFWVIGSTGPEQFFLNLRMSATNMMDGLAHLGLLERFSPLIFSLFLFENIYAHRNNRHLRFLLWCCMLLYAVGNMSKLSILTPFLSYSIIQGVSGRLKIRKIVILTSVIFASMVSLHFIRAAVGDSSTLQDLLAIYIYSPIVALGYMDIDSSLPFGAYVFRFFYVVGSHLDIVTIPAFTLGYTEVPEPTNVYTVMGPFYYDFGLLGILFGAFFYGLCFSYLYLKTVKGEKLALALYSGYSIVLIMQFFADVGFAFFSGNLQILIYTLAVFLASRKVLYAR